MTFIITTSSIDEASIAEVGLPLVTLGLAVPAPPTSLTATADGTTPEYVDLAWTASASAPVTGYKVFRALGGSGSYTQIGTTASTSYDDDTTAASTEYDYYVVAYNNAGDSAASNVDTITTGAGWVPDDLGTDLISEWDIWDSSKVTLVSGDISQVTDLRAVANMVQATAGNRPTLTAAAWNGQDIGTFTRTQSDILRTGTNATYNQTAGSVSVGVFAVFSKARVSAEYVFSHYLGTGLFLEMYCWNNANTVSFGLKAGNTNILTTANLFTVADNTPTAVYIAIENASASTANWTVYLNGSSVAGGTGTAFTGTMSGVHANTAMGGRYDNTTFSESKFGMMAITKYLTPTQIGDMFTWANTKFALY